jgi:hypothetical protein
VLLAAPELPPPEKSPDYIARYGSRQMYIDLIAELQARYKLDGFVQPFTLVVPTPNSAARTAGTFFASRARKYASVRDANHRRGAGALRESGHDAAPIVLGRGVWIGRGAAGLAASTR